MVQKIGLLPASNLEQLPFAFAMYERDDKKGLDLSIQFKRTFSIDARIKFLGLWYAIQPIRRFPILHLRVGTQCNPLDGIKNACLSAPRAMPLRTSVTRWLSTNVVSSLPHPSVQMKLPRTRRWAPRFASVKVISMTLTCMYRIPTLKRYSSPAPTAVHSSSSTHSGLVIYRCSFSDVGGGSVRNGERHSLSRIPLRWMIRECFKVDTGIIFDAHMLKNEVGLDVNSILEAPPPHRPATFQLDMPKPEGGALQKIPAAIISALYSPYSWIRGKPSDVNSPEDESPPVQPLPTSENESQEELNDAISQIHDQLKKYAHWRVMEWIPCKLPL